MTPPLGGLRRAVSVLPARWGVCSGFFQNMFSLEMVRFRDARGRFIPAPLMGRQYGMYGYAPLLRRGVHGWPARARNFRSTGLNVLKGAAAVAAVGYSAYKNYFSTKTNKAMVYRRSYRRKGRSMRRGRRGRKPRYAKKVLGSRRGRRYTSRAGKAGKRLITNMSRNDVRTLRVVQQVGGISVAEGTPVANNQRFICHLDHWTTRWARVIEAYEEFKFKDVQFVITPRSIINGAASVRTERNEIPYLAVRTVNPIAPSDLNIAAEKIRATPGYRFLPITAKRRYVHNVSPGLEIDQHVFRDTGTTTQVNSHRTAPWLKIETNTKALDLCAIEVRRPGLDIIAGHKIEFDVTLYATLCLRGNNDELVDPY